MKKLTKKQIEENLKSELNSFMHQFGIKSIDFGNHKLKRRPKCKNKS